MLYVRRFFRIMPIIGIAILVGAYGLPFMLEGPVAYRYSEIFSQCKTHWYANIFFINNFYPITAAGKLSTCLPWTWALSAEMQMFLFLPFIILIFRSNKLIGFGVLNGLFMFGCLLATLI